MLQCPTTICEEMKHLDPIQINSPAAPKQPTKMSLFSWLLGLAIATVGLGMAGSYLFPTDMQDRVSDKERQERQIAFTKVRSLQIAEVETGNMDSVLDEMRLPPPDRARMRAMLPATEASQTSGGPVSSVTPSASGNSPLRLVSAYLWDTNVEDGDVVAINSAGYRREIVLTKAGQMISFPVDSTSVVQIVGVRDGGGGITLGIRGPSQEIMMPIMSEGQVLSLPIGH